MKRLTLLSIGLVIGLAGCNFISNPSNVQGSGIAKTEKRAVASFDSLDVNYVGSIQVRSQEQKSLEITGDDNIIPFITTEVKNGTLYIRSSKGYSPRQKLQIIVSTPDLKKFVFDGVGEANLSNVKNDRLEILLRGVGSFSASGETKEADITLSGVGSVDAKNLHAVNARAKALWQSLPPVYRQCAICYTDFWAAYGAVLPRKGHRAVGKESGLTNRIERFNCTLRQRISRLVRKTLSNSCEVG